MLKYQMIRLNKLFSTNMFIRASFSSWIDSAELTTNFSNYCSSTFNYLKVVLPNQFFLKKKSITKSYENYIIGWFTSCSVSKAKMWLNRVVFFAFFNLLCLYHCINAQDDVYQIGFGIGDITGPAGEINMVTKLIIKLYNDY